MVMRTCRARAVIKNGVSFLSLKYGNGRFHLRAFVCVKIIAEMCRKTPEKMNSRVTFMQINCTPKLFKQFTL